MHIPSISVAALLTVLQLEIKKQYHAAWVPPCHESMEGNSCHVDKYILPSGGCQV